MIITDVNFKFAIPLLIFRTRNYNFSILQPYSLTDTKSFYFCFKDFYFLGLGRIWVQGPIIIFSASSEICLNLLWTKFTITVTKFMHSDDRYKWHLSQH